MAFIFPLVVQVGGKSVKKISNALHCHSNKKSASLSKVYSTLVTSPSKCPGCEET